MNSHEHCAALLDAFIDGALSGQEAEEVRTHLTTCPECQSYVSDALTMRDLFPGIEETVVPDGFAESVLSSLPPRKSLWRTQWRKIAVPLAACLTLVLLVRGISGGLPKNSGATETPLSATDTGGGMTESAVTTDTDLDGVLMQSASIDDAESAPESDMDGGAVVGSVYGAWEEPETEESAVFATPEVLEESAELFDASEVRNRRADNVNTSMDGASYDDSDDTDSADAAPSQAMKVDTIPPETVRGDTTPSQTPEGDTAPPQTVEGGVGSPATPSAPSPEPEKRQRVAGTASTEGASASGFSMKSAPETQVAQDTEDMEDTEDTEDMEDTEDAPELRDEASPESVDAAGPESVAVSFRTLSPDAAPMLEAYPVAKETASGVWYALDPEQFDALLETLPESALTPMDVDSLTPDDAPPLRDRASAYLFLPRSN